ncbi:MAG: phospho-sugar mutase [Deltaproteobacteria bacterium]|nr:phospho-sugar mutase [Deltaproteobacteria bacterium]
MGIFPAELSATLNVRPQIVAAAEAHLARWLGDDEFLAYRPLLSALVGAGRWGLLVDSFYQVMPFGTGGRRGTVGVGPNRFNPWTLAASVQGHVAYLRERRGQGPLHVVIAYDVRCFRDAGGNLPAGVDNPLYGLSSRDFAEIAAGVYAANGVHTTLIPPGSGDFMSTPELSFAIRQLGADAGLNVSASHNPPDDNGGKFYNHLGGQEVPPGDEDMGRHVDAVRAVRTMAYAGARAAGWVRDYPRACHDAYIAVNVGTSLVSSRSARVVFTGLHGTGDTSAAEALVACGFRVDIEPTQAPHDGAFPEVPFRTPNPEVPQSMDRAVALAKSLGADLVMACDPDADRIGLVARANDGSWRFFTGNEIAALLAEHRLVHGRWSRPIVMKTEVTSELVTRIARRHGAQVVGDLMVGFKYIGDGLRQLEDTGRFAGVEGTPADLVIGVEESHGVLVTAQLRDKDAAGAAVGLAEMASRAKDEGQTLVDVLEGLWAREGYVVNRLVSTVMRGATGKARIERIQASLRADPPREVAGLAVTDFADRADPSGPLGPIKSGTDAASRDVLVFRLGEGARLLLRPSGTEPKNKVYVEVIGAPGEPKAEVDARADRIAYGFAAVMLARGEIVLPGWALRVSDLVAVEQKQHFAEVFVPGLWSRQGDPGLQAWIDAELRPYGKDPRGLVLPALRAWAAENPGNERLVEAVGG